MNIYTSARARGYDSNAVISEAEVAGVCAPFPQIAGFPDLATKTFMPCDIWLKIPFYA
ncbi:MAG: hypothetical protein LBK01_07590 [Burkholderiaceae bacterium]|nr:hypothetical protein [Burkholderiaceae bacterium]